jgi:hypothetical protein
MLFEVKTARFSIVFMNLKHFPIDYQSFTKNVKNSRFYDNRFIFQNDARILASF